MGAIENIAEYSKTLIKRLLRSGELVRVNKMGSRKAKARAWKERHGFNTGPPPTKKKRLRNRKGRSH